jgi:hypothetical protein
MSNVKAMLLFAALMGMSGTAGHYNYPAPSTDGQKLLFNQPKKLSKKQKAKMKNRS